MGFEEKTPDLLALLTAHAGSSSPVVAMTPRPPTPVTTRTLADVANKKRKWGQGGKGSKNTEEGEIIKPPAKKVRAGKGQPKKPAHTGTFKEVGGDQPKKASIWRPIFTLSSGNLILDDANSRDPKKGNSSLVAECLEKALCMPEDMAKLMSFRKRKVFLALKHDLAKVLD